MHKLCIQDYYFSPDVNCKHWWKGKERLQKIVNKSFEKIELKIDEQIPLPAFPLVRYVSTVRFCFECLWGRFIMSNPWLLCCFLCFLFSLKLNILNTEKCSIDVLMICSSELHNICFYICLSELMLPNFFWTFSELETFVCVFCLKINGSKFFYRHFKLYLTATAEHFSERFQALIVDGEGKEKEYRVQWQDFFTGHVVG